MCGCFCLIYFLLNVGSYGYELVAAVDHQGFSGKGDAIVGFINAHSVLAAGIAMLDRQPPLRSHRRTALARRAGATYVR